MALTAQPHNFQQFFHKWTADQNQQLHELLSLSKSPNITTNTSDSTVCALVNRVITHYEEYYRVKSHWTKDNVLLMLSPPWITILEDAFLWIGGWRPTMAFHLLYAKSGLQFEARLADLIRGIQTGDLGDLGPNQIRRVDQLQMRTIKEEREITEKLAKQQEKVADSEMVELSHKVTELMERGEVRQDGDRIESILRPKEEGLERILGRADDLRLRTLKGVIEILSPPQALHFLIAAAELHLRLHDWGKEREDKLLGRV